MPASSEVRAFAPDEVLEIVREFEAPRELVWRLWSSPEHIARWWGPETCWLDSVEMDFREGGRWAFWMRNGTGLDHRIGGNYRRIEPPARLTFTYVNAYDGHEMEVDLAFADLGDGRTRMHFVQAPFLNVAERDGHAEGWTSTFGLLATYLSTMDQVSGAPFGQPRRDGVAADIAAARDRARHWWGEGPATDRKETAR